MFLTDEKKRHNSWQGTFYTRKWNDDTSIAYFEKLYGGKPLLKKINQIAEQNNLIFNSSMVDESNSETWRVSGWEEVQKLNVLSLNLKHIKSLDEKVEGVEVLTRKKIPKITKLDHKIFESYWQNSTAAFNETISVSDVAVMRAWFARHGPDAKNGGTSYPGYCKWIQDQKPTDKNYNNYRGAVAWLIWGGDAAYKWIKSKKIREVLKETYPKRKESTIKNNLTCD